MLKFLAGFLLTIPLACIGSTQLSGRVAYANSAGIVVLDLATGTTRTIVKSEGNQNRFEGFAGIAENRFVASTWVAVGDTRSYVFDANGQQGMEIGKGVVKICLPVRDECLLFDGGRLYVANINAPAAERKQVIEDDLWYSRFVQISDSQVVFHIWSGTGKGVYQYDLASGKLEKSALPHNVIPVAWRDTTRQLICHDSEHFLSFCDTAGAIGAQLKLPSFSRPILYINELDAMLIATSQFRLFGPLAGETETLWLYRFSDSSKIRILNDFGNAASAIRLK